MANFDYRDNDNSNNGNRFPENTGILGTAEWRRLVMEPSFDNLMQIRNAGPVLPQMKCPRIFVSHRKTDNNEAERIAWIACNQKFEFWLDVYDPLLASVSPGTKNYALLVAGIIEMALINCTHVIAVMTNKSHGSAWIPYEYGRILNQPILHDTAAAAWLAPAYTNPTPEYMMLRGLMYSRNDIEQWLQSELRGKTGCACTWTKPIPLPVGGL